MSERPNVERLRDLVSDAVSSSGLDEDARVVARLIGVQFRDRLGHAQAAASSAASSAAETAAPVVRRAGRDASARVRPVARQGARTTRDTAAWLAPLAQQGARDARETAERLAPVARRGIHDASRALGAFAASPTARSAAAGAAAGAGASVVMGGVVIAAQKLGFMGRIPPRHITERSAHKVAGAAEDAGRATGMASDQARQAGERVRSAPPQSFDLAASILHVGFGAALGVGFGALHAQLPAEWRAPVPTLGESLAFATAVWAVSYAGWIPALGLMPPPQEDEPGRPVTMIVAHWVFGAVLGVGLIAGVAETR